MRIVNCYFFPLRWNWGWGESTGAYFSYNESEVPVRFPSGYVEKAAGPENLGICRLKHTIDSLLMNRQNGNPWQWWNIAREKVKNKKRLFKILALGQIILL